MFTIHVIHPTAHHMKSYTRILQKVEAWVTRRSVGYTLQLLLIRLSITVLIIVNKMCHTTDVKIDNSFS